MGGGQVRHASGRCRHEGGLQAYHGFGIGVALPSFDSNRDDAYQQPASSIATCVPAYPCRDAVGTVQGCDASIRTWSCSEPRMRPSERPGTQRTMFYHVNVLRLHLWLFDSMRAMWVTCGPAVRRAPRGKGGVPRDMSSVHCALFHSGSNSGNERVQTQIPIVARASVKCYKLERGQARAASFCSEVELYGARSKSRRPAKQESKVRAGWQDGGTIASVRDYASVKDCSPKADDIACATVNASWAAFRATKRLT